LKWVLLIAAVSAFAAPAAQADTTVVEPPEAHHPYQQWVDSALVPTPTVTLSVREADDPCGNSSAFGCTDQVSMIELKVMDIEDRQAFLHELGHVWDHLSMLPEQRARFVHLIRQPALPWDLGHHDIFDRLGANEWFADSYAFCARKPGFPRHTDYNVAGGVLGGPAMTRICGMIRRGGT
jgi:hypothetical protein